MPENVAAQFEADGEKIAPDLVTSRNSTGVSFKLGQIMGGFHPHYSFGSLDVHLRWQKIGFIEGASLDINQTGQYRFIDIEKAGSTIAAKEPSAMFR